MDAHQTAIEQRRQKGAELRFSSGKKLGAVVKLPRLKAAGGHAAPHPSGLLEYRHLAMPGEFAGGRQAGDAGPDNGYSRVQSSAKHGAANCCLS